METPFDLARLAHNCDPSVFLSNAAHMFALPGGSPAVDSASFSAEFLRGIEKLHQSLISDSGLPAAAAQPTTPVALYASDEVALVSPFHSAAARRISQAGGHHFLGLVEPAPLPCHFMPRADASFACSRSPAAALPLRSDSPTLFAFPSSPAFPPSPSSLPPSPQSCQADIDTSKESECFVSAVLGTAPPAPCQPPARTEFVLDYETVSEDIASSWAAGSSLYPFGAGAAYAASFQFVEKTIKQQQQQQQQQENNLQSVQQRLAQLVYWAPVLDNLSPQNKAAIWTTCELAPLFGEHDKSSFRSTIRKWAQEPDCHANSIRILFGAIGYLKYNDVLKNQFLCLRTGEHIFRTFVFEEPVESPRPTRVKKRTTRQVDHGQLRTPPAKTSRSASSSSSSASSFVDVLAEAAVMALLEEHEHAPQKTSKRDIHTLAESCRSLKRQRAH